jgi:hypothetical protein
MVVTEIRNAVIDTVEFILPPFIKLSLALMVANYVTFGIILQYLNTFAAAYLRTVDASSLKKLIDSLYLGSIVPIIAILLIILIAYSINRVSSFVGSLVPITYSSTTIIRTPYYTAEIWKYFPQIKSSYELRLKVTQLLSVARSSSLSLPFHQIEWQQEGKQRKFSHLNFINFLLLWSIFSYVIVDRYVDPFIAPSRLLATILSLLLVMVTVYFQVVQNELDIETTELMIVDSYLRTNSEYKQTERLDELDQIDRLIRLEHYYSKRWWSLSIGYRLDWLKMHRHYRPPFYWAYIKWKDRREIQNGRKHRKE